MDKSKITKYVSKMYPTVYQKYMFDIDAYLKQIEGVTDSLAKTMVEQFIVNKLNKQ